MGMHFRGLSWFHQPCVQNLRVPRDGRRHVQYVNGHHYSYGTDGDGSQGCHCWLGCKVAHSSLRPFLQQDLVYDLRFRASRTDHEPPAHPNHVSFIWYSLVHLIGGH